MKVLLINQFCGHGSTGRICTDIYDLLVSQGHECCIAYGRYDAPKDYHTYKIGGTSNVLEHVFETRFLDNHGFSSRKATKKFIQFIEDYNPDVIHIHNLHGYYVNIEILLGYLRDNNKKIIWTFHDCWNFSPRTAYIDYDDEGKLPQKQTRAESRGQYPEVFIPIRDNYKRKEKSFYGFQNLQIVTPSDWLSDMVRSSFLSSYSTKTIYNGIDLEQFCPASIVDVNKVKEKYRLKNKKIILGVASAWDWRKGLVYMNEISKNLDMNEYQVVVIGELKKGNIISKNILHINRTSSIHELKVWYSLASWFINPTLFDTFPTTNLESLACGTPVITFETGGSPESLNDNVGIVLKEKTSNKILELIKSDIDFSSEACVTRSKDFEKVNQFSKYLEMYKNEK